MTAMQEIVVKEISKSIKPDISSKLDSEWNNIKLENKDYYKDIFNNLRKDNITNSSAYEKTFIKDIVKNGKLNLNMHKHFIDKIDYFNKKGQIEAIELSKLNTSHSLGLKLKDNTYVDLEYFKNNNIDWSNEKVNLESYLKSAKENNESLLIISNRKLSAKDINFLESKSEQYDVKTRVKEKDINEINKKQLEKKLNTELHQKSAGGKFKEVRLDDCKIISTKEVQDMRREYIAKKEDLIKEWEKVNNLKWPTYKEDFNIGGIHRLKGDKYDLHHVQQLHWDGKNEVDNITPMHIKDHTLANTGIHRANGPYKQAEIFLQKRG